MRLSKHLWAWFLLMLIFIPVSLVSNYSIIEKEVVKERQQVALVFGDKREEEVLRRSVAVYKYCCAPVADALNSYYISDEDGAFNDEASAIIENIFGSVFQVILRAVVYLEWTTWLLPMVAFFVVDALVKRRIRNENLTYQSPVKYHLGLHGVVLAVGLSFSYLFFPFSISVAAIPVLFIMFTYSIYVATVNLQRMI